MLKGVKKIRWTGKGTVYTNRSIPNQKLIVAPDQWVYFEVGEWFPGTTDADKKKNMTWFRLAENRRLEFFKKSIPSDQCYACKISKKQCGSYLFYVEACLSGIKDPKNNTGLSIGGYCPPKVVSSRWTLDEPGNDAQLTASNPTEYGRALKLHLETEGLNGNYCTVVVFNAETGEDLPLKKTYRVRCVNGEIDVNIPAADTMGWNTEIGFKQAKEQFYIQLKSDGVKGYIPDAGGAFMHATHLYLNNKIGTYVQKTFGTTVKTAKTGQAEVSIQKFGCGFERIWITDRGKDVIVFDHKKELGYAKSITKFEFDLKVYYDTDQSVIKSEAKPVLDNLVKFLKLSPTTPLLIASHADIRQGDAYNQNLSEARSDAIHSYLNTHGVTNKITSKGLGESQSRQYTYLDKKDTDEHKMNRRTVLTFYTPVLKPVLYNTIVPTNESPVSMDFVVANFKIDNCIYDKGDKRRHTTDKVFYKELTNEGAVRTVGKDISVVGGRFKSNVFSDMEEMILPIVMTPGKASRPNSFEYYINCCNYFPDKTSPTVLILAYSDAVWMLHAQYDYQEEYFFSSRGTSQKVAMVKGIDTIYNKAKPYLDMYFRAVKVIPMMMVSGFVQELLVGYIKDQSDMYSLGYHQRWNWVGGRFNGYGREKDYTAEYRIAVEVAILTLTVLVIVVEVLIMILTAGESAAAKLPRLKKLIKGVQQAQKAKKEMEDLGFEFVFPQVAVNRGFYYHKGTDGDIYFMIEDNVTANPLIEIKYEKKFTLAKRIVADLYKKTKKEEAMQTEEEKDKEGKEKSAVGKGIQDLLEKIGNDASLTLTFSGKISAGYSVKFAIPVNAGYLTKGPVTVLNHLNKALNNSSGQVINTGKITGKVVLEAKGRVQSQFWAPVRKYLPSLEVKAGIKLNIESYISHERTYGVDIRMNPFYKDMIYFSGIKGSVMLSLSAKVDNDKSFDIIKPEPMDFVLMDPETIKVADVKLY